LESQIRVLHTDLILELCPDLLFLYSLIGCRAFPNSHSELGPSRELVQG
jgi:hypothetical protein